MNIKSTFLKPIIISVMITLLMAACAYCHLTNLVAADLNSGFSHPLEGWDHIVTMLGVGIWAAQLRGKAIWLLPTTFVSVMSLGGISGAAKYLAVPSAEILILLSCLVFSALIIRKIRFNTQVNVLIVAFFAFFHGYAHGAEISASASLISYTLGFMLATLLLHGTGILVTKVILLSVAFLIAHISQLSFLKTDNPTTTEALVSYSMVANTQLIQDVVSAKHSPPLINLSQWYQSLSRLPLPMLYKPMKINWCNIDMLNTGIEHLKSGVGLTSPPRSFAYFVLASLIPLFIISQFFCYVFYPVFIRASFALTNFRFIPIFTRCISYILTPSSRLFYFPPNQPKTKSYSRIGVFVRSKKSVFNFTRNLMTTSISKNIGRLFGPLILFPNFAHAHSMSFITVDWLTGFIHPLQGIDHVFAMLAVGLWAAQLRGNSQWLLPGTFVCVMGLGSFIGILGFDIPDAEIMILLSSFVLGAFAFKNTYLSLSITLMIVGFFAFFHGYAHGIEIANSANVLLYSLGFMMATSFLHITGMMLAHVMNWGAKALAVLHRQLS
jgi:hydrogenase/urease accessory protein HupE